jgi:hypothetical protein
MWKDMHNPVMTQGATVTEQGHLVPVVFVPGEERLAALCSALQTRGIPARIGADQGPAVRFFLGEVGRPILVSEDDYERACEILSSVETVREEEWEEDEEEFDDVEEEEEEDDEFEFDDDDEEFDDEEELEEEE